jgi:mono/diheme cytochrome c family protein
MKFRISLLFILTLLLSACNFTLAEDVTPPPGYIPPTPVPTLALIPSRAPNTANGAAIYVEKCAPCHGTTGLGDGPQGIQLQVTVPAFALPEIARSKSPAQWYAIVTRGNIERFMPPFASLTDQERWDVTAYVMTLHTTEDEIQKGKDLFESNCPGCSTDFFKDQSKMSSLTAVELARIVRLGSSEINAFGENLPDADMWAIAAYLRTLSFDTTSLASAQPVGSAQDQPTAVPVTETPAASDSATPSAEGTPLEGTEQAQAGSDATPVVTREGYGSVSGSIENRTGANLPANLAVTLLGYEHDFQNPSVGPQEVLSLSALVAPDGTFIFENVEIPLNRIFIAEVAHQGVKQKSQVVIIKDGETSVSLPPITLYEVSEDSSILVVDELNIFFDASKESAYEVLALYTFRNSSESIVAIPMGNQQEIPFLKFPENSQGLGYEAVQDSAPFLSIDGGFAMPPNEVPYGILAFASIAREKDTSVTQPLILPVTVVRILVPDGMEVKGDQLTKDSPQNIQGAVYQAYLASHLKAGDALTFTVSGSPKTSVESGNPTNNALLIGAGGLGFALILAGAWMYLRDRKRTEEADEEEEENEFESAEDVMDAIITLDDLHRAKKIADEAYQKRRAELKNILKEMT